LRPHLLALAKTYEVMLCVNTKSFRLSEDVMHAVHIRHIDIERNIAPWQDFLVLFQLLRCFWEIQPVVVHSITPKAGLLAMIAGFITKIPWRFHTFTGQIWENKIGFIKFFLKCVDRLIILFASRVFADSSSQCVFLEGEGLVSRGDVKVLGRGSMAGVDLVRFRPNLAIRTKLRAQTAIADTVPVFLFVGRLVRDKGVFDLVEVFGSLSPKCQSWELWIVGPDENGLQTKLQDLGERLGARIRWFGQTSNPEYYMAAADILVLPSYREGFGSVIIEAAACGIPTIAYRINGVVDAIVEGSTGLLVSKGDVEGLKQAIEYLGSDLEILSDLGQAAKLRAVTQFSSSAVSASWLALYSSVLSQMVERHP
jgi:glycosyltransferase involved in cell wall biosynthesis